MSKSYFFITGLPRSRTAWLSNLFTWRDSVCLHDAIKAGVDARHVLRQLQALSARYCGDADSGLPFVVDDLVHAAPEARWLVVHRDPIAARKSTVKYFGGSPAAALAFDRVESRFNTFLLVLKDRVPADRRMDVEFEELSSSLVLRQLWHFLTPENPWCHHRAAQLQGLRIEAMKGSS